MIAEEPPAPYIETMNRAIREAAGLAPGGPLTAALARTTPKLDSCMKLRAMLDEAALGTMARTGAKDERGVATKGAALSSKVQKAALGAAVKQLQVGDGLEKILGAMEKQGAVLGRRSEWAEQLQALSRPLQPVQLDRVLLGANWGAAMEAREAMTALRPS